MNVITPKVHVIIKKTNKLLMIKRKNTGCYDGYWCLPTGRVEMGESPLEAAKREVLEEVGLIIDPIFTSTVYVKVSNYFDKTKPDYVDLGLFFEVKHFDREPENLEPDKHAEIGWFDMKSFPQPLMPITKHGILCYNEKIPYGEFGWGAHDNEAYCKHPKGSN